LASFLQTKPDIVSEFKLVLAHNLFKARVQLGHIFFLIVALETMN